MMLFVIPNSYDSDNDESHKLRDSHPFAKLKQAHCAH